MEPYERPFQGLSEGEIRVAILQTAQETESAENGINDADRKFRPKGGILTASGRRTAIRSETGMELAGRASQELSNGEIRVALSSVVRTQKAVENSASEESKKRCARRTKLEVSGVDCGGTERRRYPR